MKTVNITELRSHLPGYLRKVNKGEEVEVTSHGKVIARILPAEDEIGNAREELLLLRKKCRIGDVVSPIGENWNADK